MENPPRASTRCSGVYQIRNTENQKRYIGSATNLYKRCVYYIGDLRRETHANNYLQRAWDKYGSDVFVFEILEFVDDQTQLIVREQHYIDTTKKELQYNMCRVAGSSLGIRRSERTRRRISTAHRGTKMSVAARQSMSNASRGRKKTPAHARAIALAHCRRSKLTWEMVQSMRAQRGKVSYPVLAQRYGISLMQTGRIMRNEVWHEDPTNTRCGCKKVEHHL